MLVEGVADDESDYESDYEEIPETKDNKDKEKQPVSNTYRQQKTRRIFKYLTIPDKNVYLPAPMLELSPDQKI